MTGNTTTAAGGRFAVAALVVVALVAFASMVGAGDGAPAPAAWPLEVSYRLGAIEHPHLRLLADGGPDAVEVQMVRPLGWRRSTFSASSWLDWTHVTIDLENADDVTCERVRAGTFTLVHGPCTAAPVGMTAPAHHAVAPTLELSPTLVDRLAAEGSAPSTAAEVARIAGVDPADLLRSLGVGGATVAYFAFSGGRTCHELGLECVGGSGAPFAAGTMVHRPSGIALLHVERFGGEIIRMHQVTSARFG
jgi:hypothetical protein